MKWFSSKCANHKQNITATLALNLFGKIQKKKLTVKNLEAIVYIKTIGLTEHGKGNKIQM